MEELTTRLQHLKQPQLVDLIPNLDPGKQLELAAQVESFGDIEAIREAALAVLADSESWETPFKDHLANAVPEAVATEEVRPLGTAAHSNLEQIGCQALNQVCIVVIAHEIGVEIGYNNSKVRLPVEMCGRVSYLKWLARCLREWSSLSNSEDIIPICIMTSPQTHTTIQQLIAESAFNHFRDHITVVNQQLVPRYRSKSGMFERDRDNRHEILTSTQGSGEVHSLLKQHGIAQKWKEQGKSHVIFLDDSNAMLLALIPALLGLTLESCAVAVTVATKRKPGEEGMCVAKMKGEGSEDVTVSLTNPDLISRLAAASKQDNSLGGGFSGFPQAINALIFRIPEYCSVLERLKPLGLRLSPTPKYRDTGYDVFVSSVAVQTHFLDITMLLEATESHVTALIPVDHYSPINHRSDFNREDQRPLRALDADRRIYRLNRRLFATNNVKIQAFAADEEGVPEGAVIWMTPSFAATTKQLASRLVGGEQIKISRDSCLLIDGDVTIESLTLDGCLSIQACNGAKVVVREIKVSNKGITFPLLNDNDNMLDMFAVRGYLADMEGLVKFHFNKPGEYIVTDPLFHTKNAYHDLVTKLDDKLANVESGLTRQLPLDPNEMSSRLFPNESNKWPSQSLGLQLWPVASGQSQLTGKVFSHTRRRLAAELSNLSNHPLFDVVSEKVDSLDKFTPASDEIANQTIEKARNASEEEQGEEGVEAKSQWLEQRSRLTETATDSAKLSAVVLAQPKRVLFVCQTNSKSVVAEALARVIGPGIVRVKSAGVEAVALNQTAMRVLTKRLLDLPGLCPTHLHTIDPADFDVVVRIDGDGLGQQWQDAPCLVESWSRDPVTATEGEEEQQDGDVGGGGSQEDKDLCSQEWNDVVDWLQHRVTALLHSLL